MSSFAGHRVSGTESLPWLLHLWTTCSEVMEASASWVMLWVYCSGCFLNWKSVSTSLPRPPNFPLALSVAPLTWCSFVTAVVISLLLTPCGLDGECLCLGLYCKKHMALNTVNTSGFFVRMWNVWLLFLFSIPLLFTIVVASLSKCLIWREKKFF